MDVRFYCHRPGRFPLGSIIIFFILLLVSASLSAEVITSETCLDCHDDMAETLSSGAHQLETIVETEHTTLACMSCHSGGEEHIEDPSTDNITNPARATGRQAVASCLSCHELHHQSQGFGWDPHVGLELSCSSCHAVHGEQVALLLDDKTEFCKRCHVGIDNEFRQVSNHPVADGSVTCMSCHDFTGRNEPNFGHGGNARCFSCHPEQSGPYLSEHEATSSFSTEGDGCVACHTPHGSPNERLLTQPGVALCRQCHGEPPTHRTAHYGEYSGLGCMDCHTEIHGSHEPQNRFLLDPNLGAKLGGSHPTCFCHEIGR